MNTTSPLGESLGGAAATVRATMPKPPRTMAAPRAAQAPQAQSTALFQADAVSLSFPAVKGKIEQPEAESPPTEVTAERIRRIVEEFQQRATTLQFEIDDTSDQVVVRVLNRATGEVIRQIPPEEMIRMAQRLSDLRGVLFSQTL